MSGFFGDDFDVTVPEDASPVKFGASFLRDIKARLKRFLAVMFNLETGQMKNNVVSSNMLTNLTTAGTYTEVTVNSKGLVTEGTNATTQQSAALFRAVFIYNDAIGGKVVSTTDTTITSDPTDVAIGVAGAAYGGGAASPYQNQYISLDQSNYAQAVTWAIPSGVRRIKATIIGGGGGRDSTSGSTRGGAGGEMRIANFDVEATSINTIVVIVGAGGAVGQNGGISSVKAGSAFSEAAGGTKATASVLGAVVNGNSNGVLTEIVFSGAAGTATSGGASGSYWKEYGYGAPLESADPNGNHGLVVLEWLQ